MNPALVAAAVSAIEAAIQIIQQVQAGTLTDQQALDFFAQASTHYNAARAAWDAAGKPAGGTA